MKQGDLVTLVHGDFKGMVGVVTECPKHHKNTGWANRDGLVWVKWPESYSKDPLWADRHELTAAPVDVDQIVKPKEKVKKMKKVVKKAVDSNVVIVKREKGLEIIDCQKGKFFTVIFKSKEDNREITINGRTGVKKFLRKASGVVDTHDDLKTVFNVHKMKYRKVFLDAIEEIRAGGKIYKF